MTDADEYERLDHREAAEWSLTGLWHRTRKPWGEPSLWHQDCTAALRYRLTGKVTGPMAFKTKDVFAEVKRVIAVAGLTVPELERMLKKYDEQQARCPE